MRSPAIVTYACACALLLAIRPIAGHAVDHDRGSATNRGPASDRGSGVDRGPAVIDRNRAPAESKALDVESLFAGFAKSMIGRTGPSSSQNQHCINPGVEKRSGQGLCKMSSLTTLSSPCQFFKMALGLCDLPDILMLSLNLSNVVLMLVLKGLIWGASYMQLGGGGGKGRKEADSGGVITETDVMLFLGYLVADESGRNDCLNRVACEQPSRAESYLRSARMVWNTAKSLDGVIPLDQKYETILERLQEAIEDGRANGDCQAKYQCSDQTDTKDKLNWV